MLLEPLRQIHVEDRRRGEHRGGVVFRRRLELVADLLLGDVGAADIAVVHLAHEEGIGNPGHLLHALVGQEAAHEQEHAKANQEQIDEAEAPVRGRVVLADRHATGARLPQTRVVDRPQWGVRTERERSRPCAVVTP